MKRIDGGYISLFEKAFGSRSFKYNLNPKGQFKDELIGALQPIASMAHDAQYTFKPYRSSRDFLMDLAQPIRGLKNILLGFANLILAPSFFFRVLLSWTVSQFNTDIKGGLISPASGVINGISSIIRGISQIVTFPLTWLKNAITMYSYWC